MALADTAAVLPELIYIFRNVVIDRNIMRAFLEVEAGGNVRDLGPLLLEEKLYHENFRRAPGGLYTRALRIREVFRMCDPRSRELSYTQKAHAHRVCIRELSSMLSYQAEKFLFSAQVDEGAILADRLLGCIFASEAGGELRLADGEIVCSIGGELLGPKEVERQLSEQPLSGEHAAELMIAALYILGTRQVR